MQTFLPYPDLVKSAACLDNKRLGNQRRETKTILGALINNNGWRHHPAVKMWKGHEGFLAKYGLAICQEWVKRGKVDNTAEYFRGIMNGRDLSPPPWFGNERFHSSHRSNLLRKDFSWYSQFNWPEPANMAYIWPTKDLDLG